jgi:hypothetical protein
MHKNNREIEVLYIKQSQTLTCRLVLKICHIKHQQKLNDSIKLI